MFILSSTVKSVKLYSFSRSTLFINSNNNIRNMAGKIAISVPNYVLNNGRKCPAIGLGTWLSLENEAEKAVRNAIEIGYRHIDTAMLYNNEKEIGKAIRDKIADGTVTREELFIVTKLWNTDHEYEKVVGACKKSLENFGLDYIDLYLIHWPVALKSTGEFNVQLPFENLTGLDYDYVETWKGMEDCVKLGLAKSIGVSNFNAGQLQRVLDMCSIKPVMNQIEVTPNLQQQTLINFCNKNNIHITAYSPFGSPNRPWAKPGDPILSLDSPVLVNIVKQHRVSPAQVVLKFLIQRYGVIPIPKSSNVSRMRENLEVFKEGFVLTDESVKELEKFECNGRAVAAREMKDMPNYPF